MRPSQNPPLPPRIYPSVQHLYATPPPPQSTPPSQNKPLFQQLCATLPESTPPSRNIPLFQQLCATLPKSNPPSQNIPPFSTPMCHPPRIYHSLPEYTPSLFSYYMRPSQNLPLPPRIYPPFSTPICDPPRIYHSLPEYTPSLFSYYMQPSQNLPLRPKIPSPFSTTIILCDPSKIYPPLHQNLLPLSTTICNTYRIYP